MHPHQQGISANRLVIQFRLAVAFGLIFARTALPQNPQPSPGYSIHITAARPDGTPLPYASISIREIGLERFFSGSGEFHVTGLAAGSYHIRVKQIGYSAADTVILLGPDSPFSNLRIALQPIAVQLGTIIVSARAECVAPKDFSSDANSDLATILGEVAANAERHNVLINRYPFTYSLERIFETRDANGLRSTRSDTVGYGSAARWNYAPGSVIQREADDKDPDARVMRLPQLQDLADPHFLESHCFTYGGTESEKGRVLHKIDFTPLESIRETDVEGSVFIDSKSFLLTSALFRLTRSMARVEVRTTYREVFPNLLIFDRIESVQSGIPVLGLRTFGVSQLHENQRLLNYHFVTATPGDSIVTVNAAPPASAPNPGAVGGTVLDVSRKPIAGATVATPDGVLQSTTDANGKFLLAGLASGSREIVFWAAGYLGLRIPVDISSNMLTSITVTLFSDR